MKDIIEEIIRMDKESRKKMAEAEALLSTSDDDIAKAVKEMKERYRAEADHRIELNKEADRQQAEERFKGVLEALGASEKYIEQTYRSHKDAWIDEMYQRIITHTETNG